MAHAKKNKDELRRKKNSHGEQINPPSARPQSVMCPSCRTRMTWRGVVDPHYYDCETCGRFAQVLP